MSGYTARRQQSFGGRALAPGVSKPSGTESGTESIEFRAKMVNNPEIQQAQNHGVRGAKLLLGLPLAHWMRTA